MAALDHDAYLAGIANPEQRAALSMLRRTIRLMLPDAIECVSYAMPAFRQPGKKGKVVIGYAAFAKHCAIYPHSGRVIPSLADRVRAWKTSKSGVLFTPDHPLPDHLVQAIINARLNEIAAS